MTDYIVMAVIGLIIGGAVWYVIKAKKSGKKCIGCPDSIRHVKTLSGGESFKASLCLALGMADEIQATAGGVRLDTMFVDEGFGSLDEESLAQALQVLSSLSGGNTGLQTDSGDGNNETAGGKRLVGIISHVDELKLKIPQQIQVTKTRTGFSKARIVSLL